jgi:hypothetical protein
MTATPILVVCDRCRAEGLAGEDPFEAFGELLDFEPVPRRTARADGWDAETQRAYIAALSLTGSDRAACRAVARSAFGVTQLLAHEGGASFAAAREEALAIAGDERSRRLAEGLRAVAADEAGWRRPDPPWSRGRPPLRSFPAPGVPAVAPAGEERDSAERRTMEAVETLVGHYYLKLREERRARFEGRIVAADLYLRQLTYVEVMMDLLGRGEGGAIAVLRDYRCGGRALPEVAETIVSRMLDDARRRHWTECGERPRPGPPPDNLLAEAEGGLRTEPGEFIPAGTIAEINARLRAFAEQHARDADAQVEWEAEARRDYDRRRDSAADS